MSRISINKCINISLIAVSLLIFFVFIIISFIAFESIALEKLHKTLHAEFKKINNVVTGRDNFDSLIQLMQKYNYYSSNYSSTLQNFLVGSVQKESLLTEIRNFAAYLNDFQNKQTNRKAQQNN
ncbi:MAG: hypothetical protein ABDH59_04060 [Fervidobacterium sp.]